MIAFNCSPQVDLHAISPAFSVDKTISFPVQFLLQLHNILFTAMIDIYQIFLYFLLPLASILFISKYCHAKLPLYNNVPIVNLPLFGMFPSFLLALKYSFHDVVTDLLQAHRGTFIFKGPSFCNFEFVATSDPSNLEHILKTNFSNFCKGQSTRTVTNDFLGENYFSVDGDKWLSLRKITSVKLHLAEFNKMVMDSWVGFIQSRLLPKMDDFVKESVVFDLQDVLGTLSFDGSCVMAFGVDPGQLKEFTKAFKRAEEITALRFYFPEFLWKFMKYFNLGWEKEMKTSIMQLNDFAREVITSRKMELSKIKSKFDMLSLFIESKEVGDNQDWDKFLRDISLNILFAGSDTISVAMSWFFWVLCKNPIAEKQIYQEVAGIVGKSDDINAMFRPEEVKKMDYLHAAIAESLRLYPPVPLNQREVNRDDELPNGVKLKKGVRVITFMYAMGRMESIWGKDCREFKPERWLRDGKFMPESPYKWPVFNAGFRNCMGKDLAYYQMKIVAASVLYRYRIHLVEIHPVEPRLSTMLHMKYGLKVTLSQRNNLDC